MKRHKEGGRTGSKYIDPTLRMGMPLWTLLVLDAENVHTFCNAERGNDQKIKVGIVRSFWLVIIYSCFASHSRT